MPFEEISNPRDFVPHLSDSVNLVFKLGNQRYFEPGPFAHKLADALRSRGVEIRTGASVVDVQSTRKPVVELSTGERLQTDNVVIATGAWLPKLARRLGVRTCVQAGRGYSFSVGTGENSIDYPVYLPAQRLACTPYQGRFRIAGTMEFRDADAPFEPKRVQSMIKHASEMFTGINFDDRQDEWVGSRPVAQTACPSSARPRRRTFTSPTAMAGGALSSAQLPAAHWHTSSTPARPCRRLRTSTRCAK